MYIYFPHVDAYLCVERKLGWVFLQYAGDIVDSPHIGWGNWEEEDDASGNKRIYHLFPDGLRMYLCLRPVLDASSDCHYFLSSTKFPEGRIFCFHDRESLVMCHDGKKIYVMPCIRDGLKLIHICIEMKQDWTAEETESVRVQMFCELPHQLK